MQAKVLDAVTSYIYTHTPTCAANRLQSTSIEMETTFSSETRLMWIKFDLIQSTCSVDAMELIISDLIHIQCAVYTCFSIIKAQ